MSQVKRYVDPVFNQPVTKDGDLEILAKKWWIDTKGLYPNYRLYDKGQFVGYAMSMTKLNAHGKTLNLVWLVQSRDIPETIAALNLALCNDARKVKPECRKARESNLINGMTFKSITHLTLQSTAF